MKLTHMYNAGLEARITACLDASRGSLPAATVSPFKTAVVTQGVFGLIGITVDPTATDAIRRPPFE
jgi:hypothetical protein